MWTKTTPKDTRPAATTAAGARVPVAANAGPATRRGSLQCTRVAKKLLPGRPGTKKLQAQYGVTLVCVRYRHDALKLYRFTTIELVVATAPIHPKRFNIASFGVHLEPHERDLRRAVIAAGARLDPMDRLWWMRGAAIRTLGLVDRIQKT